ncbi:MAG: hypothetical protein EPN88_05090 [Bacteroidetes bacterium]|nr:MAG: hypothetical protein EPN88_05090 [Bacteroidota bacterium]
MKSEIKEWLLKSDPWTEYRTRIDLLDQQADDPDVIDAFRRMANHPKIESIINDLMNWPGKVLSSHKSASQSFHKLSFIADLGFKHTHPEIKIIINKVIEHKSAEGIFQLPMNIPVHFGGTGKDQFAWALCDAPIIVYSLAKFGLQDDSGVVKAKSYLTALCRENGYPCAVSRELGKFRGPGRKEDPCPYATMIMLKLMNLYDSDRYSEYADKSIDSLLNLWEQSKNRHPYMFFMGTDFRKLKAPLVWYDVLHFADTLSNFDQAINDKRFIEITDMIESKYTVENKYIPESEWKAWKDWDFGQKKLASAWLTFLVYRIQYRIYKATKKH